MSANISKCKLSKVICKGYSDCMTKSRRTFWIEDKIQDRFDEWCEEEGESYQDAVAMAMWLLLGIDDSNKVKKLRKLVNQFQNVETEFKEKE